GLKFVRPLVLSAPHPLGEIAFEDCRVPASDRLGAEGEGYKLGLATLDRLRATVAAAACGMAARALQEALAHATRRRQFGHTLGEFQLIQEKLARMATDLTAARLLTYRAAWEKDRGADRVTLEAAMAKAFATEAAQRIVDDAVQILGGRGVLASHPVDRLYRAVRALRIYEGTTEIQQLIVAGHFHHWDDIAVHVNDTVVTSTGHGFSGLSRRTLLAILGRRAEALGVCLEVGREVADVRALLGADLVVAADGFNSVVRQQFADRFNATVDWRPNRYV